MKKILFLLSVLVVSAACHEDEVKNVDTVEPQQTPQPLKTPEITIGNNGNWWIDGKDTGVPAQGGEAPSIEIGHNGHWWVGGKDTGVSARGEGAAELLSITWEEGKLVFVFSDGRTIRVAVEAPPTPGSPDIVVAEPAGGFEVNTRQWFRLEPQVQSQTPVEFLWKLGGKDISTDKEVVHVFEKAGVYILTLLAKNDAGQSVRNIPVKVEEKTHGSWTNRVYEFVRAPGQHANAYPTIPAGSSYAEVLDKVNASIVSKSVVSLGAYGGYVVMGFDHVLVNSPGNDFLVHGNAFANFAEPGVIEVSWDANGNGLPDDAWYEIAGSEYNAPTARHGYSLTYYNPATDTERAAGATGTRWTDNQGNAGYFPATAWPNWAGDSIVVGGSKYENLNADGSLSTAAFAYGYADNWPNGDVRAQIDLDLAVDAAGKPVHLKGIDFVKVYTGVFAHAGALGEISTEVSGVEDLNL